MQFLSSKVGSEILKEIENAISVDVASAYFYPGDKEIEMLNSVPDLRIYVSEEFSVSDPYRLEELSNGAHVRCIPVDSPEGKLHVKVILCQREDGSKSAFVGSANFTGPGLSHNHEAGIKLDSRDDDDQSIEDVQTWMNTLQNLSHVPDWEKAKKQHTKASGHTSLSSRQNDDVKYWILKTRSGSDGTDYWDEFKSEGVVAIGWSDLTVDPIDCSKSEIQQHVSEVYDDQSRAPVTIDKFANGVEKGDLVAICRGYPGNQTSPVFFYGFARITGEFYCDEGSSWWRFKYPARILEVETYLPKEVFTDSETFDKGSLRGTIHDTGITEDRFRSFCQRIKQQHGIPLRV